jgi:hypothetical protein
MLIFDAAGDIVYRTYYAYGVEQNIYLTPAKYKICVIANLDATNTHIGNAADFFADVHNLTDLKNKYIIASSRSVQDLGKIVLISQGVTDELVDFEVFTNVSTDINVPLRRLSTKIVFNVHNRVDPSTRAVLSHVYPVSWNVVNTPYTSYLMQHPGDHPQTGSDIQANYLQTVAELLPEPQAPLVTIGANSYTLQTFEIYCFENRRGSVAGLTDVRDRREMAPDFSTFVQITGYTDQAGNPSLMHYIHAGKARAVEDPSPTDWVNNFDVDRNSIYHMNIYINDINNIAQDSRREQLTGTDAHVTFSMAPNLEMIDGHYADIPSYISGLNGYAKFTSGTGTVNAQGQCSDFVPFDADPDPYADAPNGWLRFSRTTPYRPNSVPAPDTELYISLNEGGLDVASQTYPVYLHFDEYVSDFERAMNVANPGTAPARRTAVIRVGYVSGAESPEDYDAGVAGGVERVIYRAVSQSTIRTIGQMGGYNGDQYTQLLGVEHFEEYGFQFYDSNAPASVGQDLPNPNTGPFWRYTTGNTTVGANTMFDGKSSTMTMYNGFRNLYGGVPPVRGAAIAPGYGVGSTVYNPTHNTSVADYCVAKNRDYSGNGFIDGGEMKWYMPANNQLVQISAWRDYLNFSILLRASATKDANSLYWTNNENGTTNAYAIDFSTSIAGIPTNQAFGDEAKANRRRVRCVRDIEGTEEGGEEVDHNLIYRLADGSVVFNLNGYYPADMLTVKQGTATDNDNNMSTNSLASVFVVSRWYNGSTGSGNTRGLPIVKVANNGKEQCPQGYSDPTGGTWNNPTQTEITIMYANRGMIDEMLSPLGTNTATTFYYHPMDDGVNFLNNTSSGKQDNRTHNHWAWAGSNSQVMTIDFATGAYTPLGLTGNTMAYMRCVKYLPTAPADPGR